MNVDEGETGRDEATLEMGPEAMRRFGYAVVDALVERLSGLRDLPVVRVAEREETESLFRRPPPESPEPVGDILEEFVREVATRMCQVDHPRCFAFVPGAGTFVGAMADALAAGHNLYAGTWVEGSAVTQIELVVTDWFRKWLGMPEGAGGTLVSGGSAANLTALVAAREARLDPAARTRAVLYTSELGHSSVERAARIAGFQADQVRKLPVDEDLRLSVDALGEAIEWDRRAGRRPFFVCANAGATSTGTIDPLPRLSDLCEAEDLWLHVDAAYGGFAVLDPRGRALLEGIGRADSITLDPHKWLYTPYEAGCVLVRDLNDLYEAFHILPAYLADVAPGGGRVNLCDYGIQLSRGTRALKIWMAIRAFGLARYRAAVGRMLDLASYFETRVEALPGFEVTSPASLGVVTFRYVPPDSDADEAAIEAANRAIVQRVWESGRAMLTSTRVRGRYVLRVCIINHVTRRSDVDELIDLLAASAAPP